MKVFVSYAFTGEDFDVLRTRLAGLRDIFKKLGLEYYINTFAPEWQSMMDNNANGGEFLHAALKNMKTSDIVFVVNTSERRSEGMLMEIGAAVAMGKQIVLAQHTSSIGKTYLNTVANDVFEWSLEQELLHKTADYFSALSKS